MLGNSANTPKFSRDYIFTCNASDLAPFLNDVISDITHVVPDVTAFFESKCKLIVTELLTNALKHSTTSNAVFGVTVDAEKVTICKADTGRPFYLERWKDREGLTWPIDGHEGQKVVIYEDAMCCLYGCIDGPNKITFQTEDFAVAVPPRPKEILEHFGLMIMTKASDRFTYEFKPATSENVFQCELFF